MLKKLFTVLALFAPVAVFAATNDFVANSNITVSGVTFGAGTADMLIMSGSESESWAFSSGTFTVTNPGSAFQVGSSDSTVQSIQVSQSGTTLACQENTTPGTSAVTLPTAAGTYTVSPSATAQCTSLCSAVANAASLNSFPTCGAASCNAGYRLSGSGASATCVPIGGGGAIVSCGAGYHLQGGLCIPTKSASAPISQTRITTAPSQETSSAVFTTTMSLGMSSNDVRRLQILLAGDKEIYPEGIVSGYYGYLTKKAVERFQMKYGIAAPGGSGYGAAGPKTRAKLQDVFGGSPTVTAQASPQTYTNISFTMNLRLGMKSSDVYRLQQLLATDKEIYVEGTLSGYFGPLTRKAVQRFQIKYGVATPADAGYGTVGPKTRAKLQEVFGK